MVIKNCKIGNFVQVNGDVYNGCTFMGHTNSDNARAKTDVEDADYEEVDNLFEDFDLDDVIPLIESGDCGMTNKGKGGSSHRGRPRSGKVVMARDHTKQDQVIATLRSLMAGKTGKDAAFVFKAFIVAGHILPATYTQFVNTFGKDVLCKTDFYDFLGPNSKVLDDDNLRAFACNIKL